VTTKLQYSITVSHLDYYWSSKHIIHTKPKLKQTLWAQINYRLNTIKPINLNSYITVKGIQFEVHTFDDDDDDWYKVQTTIT
jgi:hypothetical protein